MINSNVRHIASLIEQHVSSRGLASGDSYLTADEVAREFSVQPHSASRAMRLLAKRGVLMRKRGLGTFVGPSIRPPSNVKVQCIHVFVSPDQNRMGFSSSDLIGGILESTGSPNVQFNLLPATGQVAYVREIIERSRTGGMLGGCVLVGCLREIQEAVLGSGVPTVVLGGVYPSTSSLLSVDANQTQIGYLLAKYLLQHGRPRLALITRETWLPGDNRHHDGICRALSEMPMNCGGVMIRGIPLVGMDMVAQTIRDLLTQEDRPTGLICRGPAFAEAALRVANALGLRVPDDLEIVFDHWRRHSEIGLPHAHPVLAYKDQARLVGKKLRGLLDGIRPEQEHRVIDVQLAEEGRKRKRSQSSLATLRVDAAEARIVPLHVTVPKRQSVDSPV